MRFLKCCTNWPKFPLPILPIVAKLVVLLTNQKDYEHIKQKAVGLAANHLHRRQTNRRSDETNQKNSRTGIFIKLPPDYLILTFVMLSKAKHLGLERTNEILHFAALRSEWQCALLKHALNSRRTLSQTFKFQLWLFVSSKVSDSSEVSKMLNQLTQIPPSNPSDCRKARSPFD